MEKLFARALILMVSAVFGCIVFATAVSAHPGNADAYGWHTCYTDCESWGLSYGQYHDHEGGDDVDYYGEGSDAGYDFASENSTYIESSAELEGQEDGAVDGSSGEYQDETPDGDSTCGDVNFEDYSSPDEYYDGFMDTYYDACIEVYKDSYSEAYLAAYELAYEEYENEVTQEDESAKESDGGGILGWVVLSIFFGLPIAASIVVSIKDWWSDR